MPYALAFLLCLALLLLLIDSSSRNNFSIQHTQGEPGNDTPKLTSSSGYSQSGLNDLQQKSSGTNRASLPTDTDKVDHDLSYDKNPGSSNHNVELKIDDDITDHISMNENDQTLPVDSVHSETFKTTMTRNPLKTYPEGITEDSPTLGDKEISGQVQDTKGQPISDVAIQLHPQNPESRPFTRQFFISSAV